MTIDTRHHIVPDCFWRETSNAHAPVVGIASLEWSKETSISFMDDAGINVAFLLAAFFSPSEVSQAALQAAGEHS